ncbi:MAG: SDR family NAD(P)-dependent oxidoreductase [Bacteriovoracaceae bacterium]|nr:SDR family NAD(P)-dependent oxidoreductase [Bacteriovoracaceae bacterium]
MELKKHTILVTGVAGFIGSNTASQLLREGHRVIGLDNLNDYYDVRLKKYHLDQLRNFSNFDFVQTDINNLSSLKKIFKQYEVKSVINLAAMAGVRYSIENPHSYIETNVVGTLNLLELMKENNIKKMLLASSSSLYAGHEVPFNEGQAVNQPISPYAVSKKAAENLSYCYSHLYNMDIIIFRYFTVYGPAGRPDMSIYRFIKCIDENTPIELFGNGEQSRDFTFIDDIVRGTIRGLQLSGYHIINLGGGHRPTSINMIIEKIEKLLGKKATIKHLNFQKSDVQTTWASLEKADKLLDWKPSVCIEEGLKRTVDWYLETKEMNQKIVLC